LQGKKATEYGNKVHAGKGRNLNRKKKRAIGGTEVK